MKEPQILNTVNQELKEKIANAKSIMVFVGAGISVSSGIPTFRSAGIGKFFREQNPIYLLSREGFAVFPKLAWEYSYYIYNLCKDAQPNVAHKVLAAWQKEAKKRVIIKMNMFTTNYDGLISKVGGQPIELHGNINNVYCSSCKVTKPMSEINSKQMPPLCECGNILLPNIVLLDGFISKDNYDIGVNATRGCSLYIAVGTSGVNAHVFGFMKSVRMRPNTTLIEINCTPSHLTRDMDYVLRGTAEEILPQFEYGVL